MNTILGILQMSRPYRKQAIPKKVKTEVWKKQNGDRLTGHCYSCRGVITYDNFEAGHRIAEARGGDTTVENLRAICKPCNTSCGTKNLDDFKAMILSESKSEETMDPAFNDDVSTLDMIVDPTITVCRGINVIDIFREVPDLNSLVVIDAIHEKLPDLTSIIRKTIEEYYEIVPGAFTSCNMFEMHLCRVHKLDYYAHFAEIVSAVISDMTNYTLSTAGAPQTISVLSEPFRVIPGLRPKKIIQPTFKFGTMFDFATEYGCAIDRNGIVDGVNSIKDPIDDCEQFDLMAEVMGRIPLIINDVPGMFIHASDLAIKLTSMTSKRVSMGECIALCYWMGAPIEIIEGSPDALIHICVDFNTKTWHQIDLAENPSSC